VTSVPFDSDNRYFRQQRIDKEKYPNAQEFNSAINVLARRYREAVVLVQGNYSACTLLALTEDYQLGLFPGETENT
jgi:hypothetical protein